MTKSEIMSLDGKTVGPATFDEIVNSDAVDYINEWEGGLHNDVIFIDPETGNEESAYITVCP